MTNHEDGRNDVQVKHGIAIQLWTANLTSDLGTGTVKKKRLRKTIPREGVSTREHKRNKVAPGAAADGTPTPSDVEDGDELESFSSPVCYLSEFEDW